MGLMKLCCASVVLVRDICSCWDWHTDRFVLVTDEYAYRIPNP